MKTTKSPAERENQTSANAYRESVGQTGDSVAASGLDSSPVLSAQRQKVDKIAQGKFDTKGGIAGLPPIQPSAQSTVSQLAGKDEQQLIQSATAWRSSKLTGWPNIRDPAKLAFFKAYYKWMDEQKGPKPTLADFTSGAAAAEPAANAAAPATNTAAANPADELHESYSKKIDDARATLITILYHKGFKDVMERKPYLDQYTQEIKHTDPEADPLAPGTWAEKNVKEPPGAQ